MSIQRVPSGVWSAAPTPFKADFSVDTASVEKMISHHLDMNVSGIMLCGTCGEGAWLRACDRKELLLASVRAAGRRLKIAVQVTDNSAGRVLDNIENAASWGAEIAVVDAPYFFLNGTPERRWKHYREIIRKSSLPIGLYDRGRHNPNSIPAEFLTELVSEPNVVMLKDSSSDPVRRDAYIKARKERPDLVLLDGDEFNCVEYLKAGYDGLLLGGGVFNARIAWRILDAVKAGDIEEAVREQERMNDMMFRVYGGKSIECWLTGLKELLVQLKVFSTNASLLGYPLTETCRAQIRDMVSGASDIDFRADLTGRVCSVS